MSDRTCRDLAQVWRSNPDDLGALERAIRAHVRACQLVPLDLVLATERWRPLAEAAGQWAIPPLRDAGRAPLDALDHAEQRLGIQLPEALREWLRIAWCRSDVTLRLGGAESFWSSPVDLRWDNGVLVVVELEEGFGLGVAVQDLPKPDPPLVTVRGHDRHAESFSAFLALRAREAPAELAAPARSTPLDGAVRALTWTDDAGLEERLTAQEPLFMAPSTWERVRRLDCRREVRDDDLIELARAITAGEAPRPRVLGLAGCRRISPAGLASFEAIQGVEEVDLHGSDALADGVLEALTRWPDVQRVDLSENSSLDDDDLEPLARLPNLREVSLTHCLGLSVRALHHLRAAPLERLELAELPQLDGAWTAELAEHFGGLRVLDLSGAGDLDDAAALALVATPTQHLKLERCPQVTVDGMVALKRALPERYVQDGDESWDIIGCAGIVFAGLLTIPAELLVAGLSLIDPSWGQALDLLPILALGLALLILPLFAERKRRRERALVFAGAAVSVFVYGEASPLSGWRWAVTAFPWVFLLACWFAHRWHGGWSTSTGEPL